MVDWGSERGVSGISAHRFRNNPTKVRCLLRAFFVAHRFLSSLWNLTWQKGRGGSMGLFHKGTNPIMRNLPSWPNQLPKALPPKIITLGFSFNITIARERWGREGTGEGSTNTQSTAVSNLGIVLLEEQRPTMGKKQMCGRGDCEYWKVDLVNCSDFSVSVYSISQGAAPTAWGNFYYQFSLNENSWGCRLVRILQLWKESNQSKNEGEE